MSDRAKEWIVQATKKLMEEKSLEKIRVTEICERAGIRRPTFYYHFLDKYDVVAWIFFQSASGVDIVSVESAAESMDRMKEDFLFYKRAYEDNSQNPMWQYILEYFSEKYTHLAMDCLGTDTLDAQTAFSVRLYCYGTLRMTREWLLYDNITPSATIVKMMFASMPERLRKIYQIADGS